MKSFYAIRAYDREDFGMRDGKIDVVRRNNMAKTAAEAARLDDRIGKLACVIRHARTA